MRKRRDRQRLETILEMLKEDEISVREFFKEMKHYENHHGRDEDYRNIQQDFYKFKKAKYGKHINWKMEKEFEAQFEASKHKKEGEQIKYDSEKGVFVIVSSEFIDDNHEVEEDGKAM